MTLPELIQYLEADVRLLNEHDANVPLDCCDSRELEILTDLLEALQNLEELA